MKRDWRKLRCATFAWVLLSTGALAGQPVHRCLGEHGEIEFSGVPCSVPLPSGSRDSRAPAVAAWAIGSICPVSAADLRAQVIDAFNRHDSNALAGLILWDGIGSGAAGWRMRELSAVVNDPSVRVDFGTEAGDPRMPDIDTQHAALDITGNSADSGALQLAIVAIGGCRWLAW